MTSRSNPDWLAELVASEGDSIPIDVGERQELVNALQSAVNPNTIDGARHRQLLCQTLGTSLMSPSTVTDNSLDSANAEEQVAAVALRDNLDADPLVAALRAAHLPTRVPEAVESNIREAVLNRVASDSTGNDATVRELWRTRRPPHAWWGVVGVAAVAALWLLSVAPRPFDALREKPSRSPVLAVSRSTEPLFEKPFTLTTTSERIDRIAEARTKELRHNRYALWGVP